LIAINDPPKLSIAGGAGNGARERELERVPGTHESPQCEKHNAGSAFDKFMARILPREFYGDGNSVLVLPVSQ
jgi:hypothetical protein